MAHSTHTHIQSQSHLYTHTQLHTLNGYEISGTWGNQGHCRSLDCKLCPKDNKDGTNRKALMQLHTYTHRHSYVMLVLIYANEEQVPVKEGRGKGNYMQSINANAAYDVAFINVSCQLLHTVGN